MTGAFGSFASLINQGLVTGENDAHFRVERNFLISLLAQRIAKIKFDETWYLSRYPDVRDAVKLGVVPSGHQHYVESGYFEHRMPAAILVNEKWYLQAYPDVAEAMRAGVYKSGQSHFDIAGFREGRLPYANFHL
jgi:hypothetical protein